MQELALPSDELVDAAAVARYLGCGRSWVYENASWLGARRLGRGPKARLRFSLSEVDERLRERATCYSSRGANAGDFPATKPVRRLRRRRDPSPVPNLLPIRGRRPPDPGADERAAA